MEPLDTSWKYSSPTPSNPTPGGATTRRTSPPARQWPAGEMLSTMRHGVVAKTSNLDPTPTCRAGTEREKNQLIDELFLKDQQLQQVDTIIAELQDRITQAKRNATRRHVQSKRGAIGLTKIGHGQPDHAPGNRPSEAGTEEYPTTNRRRKIVGPTLQLRLRPAAEQPSTNRLTSTDACCSAPPTMSHATATSTHRHTTTGPQTGRDSGPASPCLNTKPTTTPSQPAATESQPISAPETVDKFVQTPTSTRAKTTTSTPNIVTRG